MSQDKEWHDFPRLPNLTVLPWLIWCVVIVTVIWATSALAEPRFTIQGEGAVITLYDEPCELQEQIANMPYKAVWVEGSKTFKGCFLVRPDMQLVIAYFDDKTVAVIPFQVLKKTVGA